MWSFCSIAAQDRAWGLVGTRRGGSRYSPPLRVLSFSHAKSTRHFAQLLVLLTFVVRILRSHVRTF